MSDKAKYILYSILDFGLTYGGTAGVIIYNYITPTNSLGFKLTLTGIVLVVALVLMAKAIFEKSFRQKYDTYLQQLAEATDDTTKQTITNALEQHKLKNNIYHRMMTLLPFAILYIVTFFGATSLESLNGTVGLILASMGAGSIFNIIKKPIGEKRALEKLSKKTEKK